ncbi:MAG: hypothetical protein OXG81_05795 [Acidobacteria bacterium]|nr:hypothetical protein [Acidobacteriota bacterium]
MRSAFGRRFKAAFGARSPRVRRPAATDPRTQQNRPAVATPGTGSGRCPG